MLNWLGGVGLVVLGRLTYWAMAAKAEQQVAQFARQHSL